MEYERIPIDSLLHQLQSSATGLTSNEASLRLSKYGPNQLQESRVNIFKILWRQISGNSLSLILVAVAVVAYATGDHHTALYVIGMVLLSIVLGFWNEYSSEKTVAMLLKRVTLQALVLRDGKKQEVPVSHLAIGDVVLLSPGSIVPADLRLISADQLEADESVLTGESEPVQKVANDHGPKSESAKPANCLFMGTEVTNGSGSGVIVAIGRATEFGKIAELTSFVRPQTQFQKGLSSFGSLIIKSILVLTVIIFAVNALLGHHIITSLLFALAVAVGLTPELLPVVVTVGLSRGAGKLAKHDVITKQLVAIENLGNMDVLCTDKTGTLTEGKITLDSHIDAEGNDSPEVLTLGLLCNDANTQHKIVGSSIDVAIWNHAMATHAKLTDDYKKIADESFNYDRQMMFTVVEHKSERTMIIKGAPERVLKQCRGNHEHQLKKFDALSEQGVRVIALATNGAEHKATYTWADTRGLTFRGFITLSDTPKASAKIALEHMERLHVDIKIITGDNEIVARSIAEKVGMKITGVTNGVELAKISGEELTKTIEQTNIFARVSPEQKLKIIEKLRAAGHTVGYMGDGVNDVPSLHSADVGISVNSAVDVAKDAAQIVLLRQGLDVIVAGIQEGRRTFINTLKYILMGTGSNFGEMASASAASFFLPFLPMSPAQILVENSLYDISQIPIASDNVDAEALLKPKHWDMKLIFNFMIFFGSLSALYTIILFLIMIFGFHAAQPLFQTAWFIEALTTEMVVVILVRTVRVPFFRSLPSLALFFGIVVVTGLGLYLPYSLLANSLNFVAPPMSFFGVLAILLASYAVIIETAKYNFFKKFSL